jgi:hypothetical protein
VPIETITVKLDIGEDRMDPRAESVVKKIDKGVTPRWHTWEFWRTTVCADGHLVVAVSTI